MNIKKLIQDYESAVCKIILCCIMELPFPLGIRKTISILKGSKSTFIIKHGLYKLKTYSTFSMFTREQLRTIIEALIKYGLIEVEFISEYENMPILKTTIKGRDFITGKYEIKIQFLEDFVDRSIPEFDDFEKQLFDALRKLRGEIAQQRDIPAFMICGDITLRELTKQKPTDTTSLIAVHGIGEKFTQNYGEKFIEAITKQINGTISSSNE